MKRIVTLALAIVMLIGCFPVSAAAAGSGTSLGMSSIGANGYQTMTASQKLVDIIKAMEGYHEYPYWDYSQYTVGFGTKAQAGDEENGVSVQEAEERLIKSLNESYGAQVNSYCKRIGKQPSQNQFDALVSFTYNCGGSWMGSSSKTASRLDAWIRNPTTEMDFVDAMGSWYRAGGEILYGLVQRRIREAIMFLKGEYSLATRPDPSWNIKSNLAVISPGALPYYCSAIFICNGGELNGKSDGVAYFYKGGKYSPLPTPTREGYTFAGWKITRNNNNKTTIGGVVYTDTTVEKNVELTAQWVEGTNASVPNSDKITGTQVWVPSTGSGSSGGSGSGGSVSAAGQPFEDVPANAWYLDSLIYVYEKGYMDGISSDAFNPDGELTRGMLVTVLYRMSGSPDVSGQSSGFADVSENRFFTDAVIWAKRNGIVNGITTTKFAPDDPLTREQAVTIFYRYCVNYKGADGSNKAELGGFPDSGEVDRYATLPMQWAVANRVITGVSTGGKTLLDPNGSLTRCQCAALIQRCDTEILGNS